MVIVLIHPFRFFAMNQNCHNLTRRHLNGLTGSSFRAPAQLVFALFASVVLTGCVSVRVVPLTNEAYPPRTDHDTVLWLDTEPASAHIQLARVIATSQSADEDRMRDKLLARARTMGADAVVAGKFDIFESMGSGPLYQSTLGPAAGSFGPYASGWGWWNPFHYDPWSYMQGSADQIRRTEYLSGTAIRYVPSTKPHAGL